MTSDFLGTILIYIFTSLILSSFFYGFKYFVILMLKRRGGI
jgi:hypothetical protein